MDPVEEVLADPAFRERYDVLERLGEGGMGVVYRGVQRSLDRPVAIKFMHGALAESRTFQERFLGEGKVVAHIIHSHVVAVFDRGVCRGVPFLVTEFVEGRSLASFLESRERIEPAFGFEVSLQVLSGLEALHAKGVIHRDLKPTNVLVAPGPVAKVHDFGIAKQLGDAAATGREKTAAGLLVGTPQYMSPEQALGQELTPASDLYAFSVVLYELLTSRRPFDAPTALETLTQVLQQPVPIPDDLPGPVVNLLVKGLAKDPAARFQSAAELRAALEPLRPVFEGLAPAQVHRSRARTALSPRPRTPEPAAPAPSAALAPRPTATDVATVTAPAEPGQQTPYTRRSPALLLGLLALIAIAGGAIVALRQPVRTLPSDAPPWLRRLEEVRDMARRGRLADGVRTCFAVTRGQPHPGAIGPTELATDTTFQHVDRTLLVLVEAAAKMAAEKTVKPGATREGELLDATGNVFLGWGLALHDRDFSALVKLTGEWLAKQSRNGARQPDPDAESLPETNAATFLKHAALLAMATQPWQVVRAVSGLRDSLLSHPSGPIAYWSVELQGSALALAAVPAIAADTASRLSELAPAARQAIAADGLDKLQTLVDEVRKTVEDRWRSPSAEQVAEARASILAALLIRHVCGRGWDWVRAEKLAQELQAADKASLAKQVEELDTLHVSRPPSIALMGELFRELRLDDLGVLGLMAR